MTQLVEPHPPLPIPTEYGGVKFRSRLEARWAVFMDTARIRWAYEFEGYQLPSGWYVPDFWLPDLNVWLEIKPSHPSAHEFDLCDQLAEATRQSVYLAIGAPELPTGKPSLLALTGFWEEQPNGELEFRLGCDESHAFCECRVCGKPGIEFMGEGSRICRDSCAGNYERPTGDNPRFAKAVEAARVKRFR